MLFGSRLVLTGMSIGTGVTIPFSDTVKVEGLTEDSLLLSRGETVLHRYRRSVEECGFSANPGEIVRGTVTFAHEVRTFRPLNDTAVYWLVDRSGYLQQRYLDSGRPEWQADAELEVRRVDGAASEFAERYDGVYQVLRVVDVRER